MNSDSSNDSESSLPTQAVHTFPSSPPVILQSEVSFEKPEKMELKSEPPAPKHEKSPKPPPRRASSEDTERPPSAQQLQRDEDEHADESDEPEDDTDTDPAEKIEDFDWEDLHSRYEDAMQKCYAREGELAQEWERLMNYFRIWVESGHEYESDRTAKRLKTRTSHVQNSEDMLERKRNHYISVVKAFESALNLLRASNFGS